MTSKPHADDEFGSGEGRYRANALVRGLHILEAFAQGGRELSLSDLADRLGASRSSLYRLVVTLEAMGYLARQPRGRAYRLTAQVMDLGYTYLQSLDVIERLAPLLEELRDHSNLSAHLGRLEGVEVVYVQKAMSRLTLVSNVPVGIRLPAHATALGRALLTGLSDQELNDLYARRPELLVDQPGGFLGLRRRLAEERERGWVVNRGTFAPGTVALAAPIRDRGGRVVLAVNVSGPESQVSEDDLAERLPEELLRVAERMSRVL